MCFGTRSRVLHVTRNPQCKVACEAAPFPQGAASRQDIAAFYPKGGDVASHIPPDSSPGAAADSGSLDAPPMRAGRMPRHPRLSNVAGVQQLFVARPSSAAPMASADLAPGRPIAEFGVLAPLIADPAVTDVFVNGGDGVFVDRGDGAVREKGVRLSAEDARALAVHLIALGGRHIDDATPCIDVRVAGGLRVHAVLPPLAVDGAVVSIRARRFESPTLDDLQRGGMFGPAQRSRLDDLVAHRRNVLIAGAAGSGKTTLLAAMLAAVPVTERIVTIEDVAELSFEHPHHVRLESRQANLEGAGAIGLDRLVREALRMRPDRLVVGECRGAEVRELLTALNTGHDGGAGTVHANGIGDVAARLEALGALAGLDDAALARQVASAIDAVVFLERDAAGRRRVGAVGVPVLQAGRLRVEAEAVA